MIPSAERHLRAVGQEGMNQEPPPARPPAWPRTVRGHMVHKTGPEGGIAWFVASESQRGAWRMVESGRDGARGQFGLSCTCPRGEDHVHREGTRWQTGPSVCRHVVLVLEAEEQGNAPRGAPAPAHPGLADER